MLALVERLVAKGVAYVVDGDVYFEVGAVPGLRAPVGQEPRRAPGRGPGRGGRAEAGSAGLRSVEGRQARRAFVGEPLGPRAAGLAHRVLGDGDEVPRRDARPSRRRRGPGLSASLVRDRPVRGGHGQAVRPLLAPQRLREPRVREDVEVARERHDDRGAARAARSGDPPALPAPGALPQSRRVRRGGRPGDAAPARALPGVGGRGRQHDAHRAGIEPGRNVSGRGGRAIVSGSRRRWTTTSIRRKPSAL